MLKKFLSNLSALALLWSGVSLLAHAQVSGQFYENPIKFTGADGTPIKSIPEFLLALVDIVFLFGMPIIVIFIIYAGFLFVTAGDNEAQISKAKTTIMWTLIGAAVLIGAKVIAMAVQTTVLSLG